MADITSRLRLYRILLRFYPLSYRTAYEDQMVQTLTDMLDDTPNGWSRLFIWTRVVIDFPAALFKEHITYMGGNCYARYTPLYKT